MFYCIHFSCSVISDSAIPWTAACQASLSITNSQSLLKLMPIETVMPSNHLILCCPLLLLPSIFPSMRVFSNESVLPSRWPKYWSFSFNISPSNDIQDWFPLGWTGWISLQSKGLSRVFSNTTIVVLGILFILFLEEISFGDLNMFLSGTDSLLTSVFIIILWISFIFILVDARLCNDISFLLIFFLVAPGKIVVSSGILKKCLVQSLSCVWLFVTSWTAACQASLSITNSQSLLKLMSIELVVPSNHLILCRSLLLPPSICPSIRVFSNESVFCIRWPKYWSFSISPSNECSGLISFRMDWLDLLAVQGTLKSLLQHHS